MRPVLVVGPFPPPVHGLSTITEAMAERFAGRGAVVRIDLSPKRSGLQPFISLAKLLYVCGRTPPRHIYLSLSGGIRQWLDVVVVVLARLIGVPLTVHHHSFAYLDTWRLSTWLCCKANFGANHVLLCRCMADLLSQRYGVAKTNVISNAAFTSQTDETVARSQEGPKRVVTIGLLSNLTVEKGVFDFLRVVETCRANYLPVRAVLAGPIEPRVARIVQERAAALKIEILGPIYGDKKRAFYRDIDVFLFPTRYANEAEPIVLIEAMAASCPVISYERGCISEMLAPDSTVSGPAQMAARVAEFVGNSVLLAMHKERARLQFEQLRSTGANALQLLIEKTDV